jgi:hypothetical protein
VNTNCRTMSGRYWPVGPATLSEYVCRAGEFLSKPTYLVRFTSKDRSRIVAWDDPEAAPITIDEFSRNPDFVRDLLQDWDDGSAVRSAQLLVQTCLTCQRSLIIDGVHRIVLIAANQTRDAELYVSELAGEAWPPEMPDMKTVCACISRAS